LIPYNVSNWYWQVGGDQTQVYSSLAMSYVPANDPEYQAWLEAGGVTTKIDSTASLYDVLLAQWVPVFLQQPLAVTSTQAPQVSGSYSITPADQAQITGIAASIAAGRGLPGGQSSFSFQGHPFTQQKFLDFANGVENYVYGLLSGLAQVVNTGSGALPGTPVAIP
jgi:hypothetical protein